jgi:hypothetical protein
MASRNFSILLKGDEIMKRLVVIIVTVLAGMTSLCGGTIYPVNPSGTFVTLSPGDFIQFVPEQSAGLPDPNPVIGDNLGQHPGGFGVGFPVVGTFFVGVFGGAIDTSKPSTAVYLWETTAPPNDVAFAGPQIQLGYWDGTAFTGYGIPQAASYLGTGVQATDPSREITSSITPLSDFDITPGFPFLLNAVRIEAADAFAHNQVTAVAINVTPEPSTMLLLGTGFVGLLNGGWRRRKQKSKQSKLGSH